MESEINAVLDELDFRPDDGYTRVPSAYTADYPDARFTRSNESGCGYKAEPLFLVKWLNMSYDETSWEPVSVLELIGRKKLARFVNNM